MSFATLNIEADARRALRELEAMRASLSRLEAEIKQTNAQMAMLNKTAATSTGRLNGLAGASGKAAGAQNAHNAAIGRGINPMSRWGNQIQWAGRQLQYNFTLPIAIAGAAAVKFALDNEKSLVRIQKVYGDAGHDATYYSKEIEALGRAFDALSVKYGVNKAATMDIAASWAAAGSSGLALAKQTDLTMKTMVLGEMEAAEATEALIAIQAQYRQNTKELTETVNILNMTENQTGISMKGLVQGFQRAAGVASSAGVSVEELAAMMASLTPATGSAVNSGNALKTIFSRLLSPTQEAAEVMQKMGINTKDAAWQSMSATQRLKTMAKAYETLNGAQKIVVSTTMGSRYQINRFDQTMKEINSTLGYYEKAISSTGSEQRNANQAFKELQAVLQSNPQQLKSMWVELQNLMSSAVAPLIPHLVYLMQRVVDLMTAFRELDPAVQQIILGGLIFLALIGPLTRYIGAVANMLGLLGSAFSSVASVITWVGGLIGTVLIAPFKFLFTGLSKVRAGISGVVGSVKRDFNILFKGADAKGSGPIVKAFNKIPEGVKKAFVKAKANVVTGAKALFHALPASAQTAMQSVRTFIASGFAGVRGQLVGWVARLGPWLVTTLATVGQTAFAGLFTGMGSAAGAAFAASGIGKALNSIIVYFMSFRGRMASVVAGIGPTILRGIIWVAEIPMKIGAAFRAAPALIGRGIQMMGTALGRAIPFLMANFAKIIPWTIRFLTSWWGLAITVALGLIYTFRNQIRNAWNSVIAWFASSIPGLAAGWDKLVEYFNKAAGWITDAFWTLPAGVRDAMLAVIAIVRAAALQVYEWFSYLNPWARHSPSLVDSVNTGMEAIKKAYAGAGNVGGIFAKAASDLAQFKRIASSLANVEMNEKQANVAKGAPAQLALFKSLRANLGALNTVLAQQAGAVSRQQAVVDKWKSALDAANAALDAQQLKLDSLQSKLDVLTAAYDRHKASLENYASAPIAGMGAMSDAIFANELAQKKLRLEMLKMEDQAGGGVDDLRDRLAALQGDIEGLRGEAADLRSAGAGSDVLGPIMAEIKAMEAQRDALTSSVGDGGAVSDLDRMQKELDALAKKGEILGLENAIKFDPMVREIDKLANAQKEMSYAEIVNGINSEKAAMAALEPQIAAATAAVEKQKAAVDAATAARDAISARYDIENAKLSELNTAYEATEKVIRDIESALNDMGAAGADNIQKAKAAADSARAAKKAGGGVNQSPGADNFDAASMASDFADVRGTGKLGREGGVEGQEKDIDAWVKEEVNKVRNALGDPFKPLRDAWDKAWAWMESKYQEYVQPIIDGISEFVSNIKIDIPNPFKDIEWSDDIQSLFDTVMDVGRSAWGFLKSLWNLFGDDVRKIWDELIKAGTKIWNRLGPELEKFREPLSQIGAAFKGLWTILKPIVAILGVALFGAIKIITSVLAHTLGPVIDVVIGLFTAVIKVIRGVVTFIIGTFSGDLSMALKGIVTIFGGMWDMIWELFAGVGKTLWGIVRGIVEGIWDWFNWLWDELVGHSIIPDLIKDIVWWFASLPGKAWNAVKDFATKMKDRAVEAGKAFWDATTKKWNEIIEWLGGRPKAAWDKMIGLRDKLFDVAKQAFSWFLKSSLEKWANIIVWIAGLPAKAWAVMIKLKEKLIDVAKQGFNNFLSNAKTVWSTINTWLGGRPQEAWNKIIGIKNKLIDVAKSAFGALMSEAKKIVDGKGGLMGWIGGIPGRIAKALGGVGSTVANAVKGAWNGAANWINAHGINNVNKVITKFGGKIEPLPRFAKGGVVPGTMTTRDSVVAMLRPQEGVLIPEAVKALGGATGLAKFNESAKRGHVPREQDYQAFRKGGVVGTGDGVTDWLAKGAGFALDKILAPIEWGIKSATPPPDFMKKWTAGWVKQWRTKAKEWGTAKDTADTAALGSTELGGIGYARMVNILRSRFPDIAITSTYRPGAITASGNRSYHSMGRAVDMSPRMDVFNWLASTYGKTSKELIYSPAGLRQIKNGSPYYYGEPVRGMHWDHVHWAYDQGGILKPGMTQAYNGTGKDELVLTNSDMMALSNVLSMMDRMVAKSGSGPTPGAAAVRSMSATVSSLESRLRARESENSQTVRRSEGTTTINIYGDLSLPNIKSGDDADLFIRHLKTLAG